MTTLLLALWGCATYQGEDSTGGTSAEGVFQRVECTALATYIDGIEQGYPLVVRCIDDPSTGDVSSCTSMVWTYTPDKGVGVTCDYWDQGAYLMVWRVG